MQFVKEAQKRGSVNPSATRRDDPPRNAIEPERVRAEEGSPAPGPHAHYYTIHATREASCSSQNCCPPRPPGMIVTFQMRF